MDPASLLYAKTHEWIHVEEADGGKLATIGISSFAIEALKDLVYLELPEVGSSLTAGEPLGEIESVKAVSDIYSPVSGEVVEANTPLIDSLDTMNEDAYGAGWLLKVKITDDSSLANLMDQAAYLKQCEEED
ncbi:MAG: glycine cleavage system protein GcvH [Pirellulales bacterium]